MSENCVNEKKRKSKSAKTQLPLAVNRYAFMRWLEGDLLEYSYGDGDIYDNVTHYEVGPALDRGESVLLLDEAGNAVSRLIQVDDENIEIPLAKE